MFTDDELAAICEMCESEMLLMSYISKRVPAANVMGPRVLVSQIAAKADKLRQEAQNVKDKSPTGVGQSSGKGSR